MTWFSSYLLKNLITTQILCVVICVIFFEIHCVISYIIISVYNSLCDSLRIFTLAKISDRNSFRANQNYSDSFRYLHPSQCESFWTNPENVLYLVWWKTVKYRSNLIRFNPRQQSEWIRVNPKPSFQSESIRVNPRSEWFGIILFEYSVWINPSSDFNSILFSVYGLLPRIKSDWVGSIFYRFSSNEIQNVFRIGSEWFALARIQISKWIGIFRNRNFFARV